MAEEASGEREQRVGGPVQQQVLVEEVAGRVAGEAQFGEDDDLRALVVGPAGEVEDLLQVEVDVGDLERRNRGRHPHEAEIGTSIVLIGRLSGTELSARRRWRLARAWARLGGPRALRCRAGLQTPSAASCQPRRCQLQWYDTPSMSRSSPSTPAVLLLRAQGVAFSEHSYRYEERGGTAVAARELGRARARGRQDAGDGRRRPQAADRAHARRPRGVDQAAGAAGRRARR